MRILLYTGKGGVGKTTVAAATGLALAARGLKTLVLSVDARRCPEGVHTESGYEVTTHGGRRSTGIDALGWAVRAEALGAGEILLNSMDADGVQEGFDLQMLREMRACVHIPLIASGGAGRVSDFVDAARTGADAVLAASVFHFGTLTVADVKRALADAGFVVRLD